MKFNLFDFIKNLVNSFDKPQKIISPVSENQLSIPTPTPTPNYEKGIREGLKEYFGYEPPVATLSSKFVSEAKKNNLSPYLLPAISVAETTAGTNQTYPNNFINWGIYAGFKPKSPEETIEKASSGIGTGRAFPYYEEFRRTGRIEDLAKHYAPPTENDTRRWVDTVKNIINLMKKHER